LSILFRPFGFLPLSSDEESKITKGPEEDRQNRLRPPISEGRGRKPKGLKRIDKKG
jgi:hypothetical protein